MGEVMDTPNDLFKILSLLPLFIGGRESFKQVLHDTCMDCSSLWMITAT